MGKFAQHNGRPSTVRQGDDHEAAASRTQNCNVGQIISIVTTYLFQSSGM
mgnify:CR=1 FL=1